MSRAVRALVLSLGIGAGTLGAIGAMASATAPSPPPTTTGTPATADTAAPPTTVVPPPGARGNALQGATAKPRHETWTARRLATITALAIVVLASSGYAYGRMRSVPPRHPDLERSPDDYDGAGHPPIGAAR
jgi:hypothetical protein